MRLRNPVKPVLNWVRRERLLSCLIVSAPVLIGLTGVSPGALPALVDWHTMAALTGLIWQFHLWSIPCLIVSSLLTAGIWLITQ